MILYPGWPPLMDLSAQTPSITSNPSTFMENISLMTLFSRQFLIPPTRENRVCNYFFATLNPFNLHGKYLLDDAIFASIFEFSPTPQRENRVSLFFPHFNPPQPSRRISP